MRYDELYGIAKRLCDVDLVALKKQIKDYKELTNTVTLQLKFCYIPAADEKARKRQQMGFIKKKEKVFQNGEPQKFCKIMNKVFTHMDICSYGMISDYSTMLSKLVKLNLKWNEQSKKDNQINAERKRKQDFEERIYRKGLPMNDTSESETENENPEV